MAVTIEASAGHASANSFVTEAEMIAYMDARLNSSTWTTFTGTTLTEGEKEALVEATRELDPMGWTGRRVNATQALSWPRQDAWDPDSPVADYYDTDVVPQRIKNAQMELAFQFVKAGTTDVAALPGTDGVKRSKIDVLETEHWEHHQARGMRRYPRIWRWIAPLLAATGSPTARLVRG